MHASLFLSATAHPFNKPLNHRFKTTVQELLIEEEKRRNDQETLVLLDSKMQQNKTTTDDRYGFYSLRKITFQFAYFILNQTYTDHKGENY